MSSLSLTAQANSVLNIDHANALGAVGNWTLLDSINFTNSPQRYFDLSELSLQQFYRVWQLDPATPAPSLQLEVVPAITLTGSVGQMIRVDGINAVGPIDAWTTLDIVTLTASTQQYYDISAVGQPPRLYRLVPLGPVR